jgi:hypothetical protein
LTDLRTLIDEALEGSPVAVTLAWNTEVLIGGARVPEDVEERLRRDYLAMFSRISNVVHISTLPHDHLLPFALAYVERANSLFRADRSVSKSGDAADLNEFEARLKRDFGKIESSIAPWGRRTNDRSVVARAWLDALRDWAESWVAAEA